MRAYMSYPYTAPAYIPGGFCLWRNFAFFLDRFTQWFQRVVTGVRCLVCDRVEKLETKREKVSFEWHFFQNF